MRLVFMGTPDFAAAALLGILADGHEVAAVYTQPDRPQGRHFTPTPPPVKRLAEAHGLPVFQPATLRDAAVQNELAALSPELIVVAAYGRILPQAVLSIPARGCVNIHASLLPRYRGAAPIQRAVIDNCAVTGVTIMKMEAGLDTGDILLTKETPVGPDETAGELFARLAALGAKAICEALSRFDSLVARPQDHAAATWAPPLKKEDGLLDWSQSAERVYARIRGVTPWPGAYTFWGGRRLLIHEAARCEGAGAPGSLLPGGLIVACGQGAIQLRTVQLEGARRITGEEFLRGQRLSPGALFGA